MRKRRRPHVGEGTSASTGEDMTSLEDMTSHEIPAVGGFEADHPLPSDDRPHAEPSDDLSNTFESLVAALDEPATGLAACTADLFVNDEIEPLVELLASSQGAGFSSTSNSTESCDGRVPPVTDWGELEVASLRQQLDLKEELIVALTDRLEQAAEQLDRLHRNGTDKRCVSSGGGYESADDQRAVIAELRQTIERWDQMQAEAVLGRIEIQITEVRDLLVQNSARRDVDHRPAHVTPPAPAKSNNVSWWESQKAALLGEGPAVADVQPDPVSGTGNDVRPAGEIDDLDLPDLPAPVDYNSLTLDEARTALADRDRVLSALRERVLILRAAATWPAGGMSLADLPSPARERFAQIETQWEGKFRQEELQLSLERARLARDEAALRQQHEQLRKQLVQAGQRAERDGTDQPDQSVAARRWFRFMGKPSRTRE